MTFNFCITYGDIVIVLAIVYLIDDFVHLKYNILNRKKQLKIFRDQPLYLHCWFRVVLWPVTNWIQASESVLMLIGRYCPFPHQSFFVDASLVVNRIALISAAVLLKSLYPYSKLLVLRHSLSLIQIPYPLQFSPFVWRYEASFWHIY